MARVISDIKKEMTDSFIQNDSVVADYGLAPSETFENAFSPVSVESTLFDVIASSFWTLEKLFDTLKTEILDIISRLKPHSLRWYVEKAKAFQFGDALMADSDKYNNAALTDAQIEQRKVIKYAACTKERRSNGRVYLRLKVAGEVNGDIGQLPAPQKAAFTDYIFRTGDAGVDIEVDSLPADQIKMKWIIYYDPLILDENGSRLDGQDIEPVQKAIKNYLKVLLFNGTYVPAYHTDAVQQVEGVVIPVITECEATYGLLPFTSVQDKYEPDGGYLRFYNNSDLAIEFKPQTEIR